MSSLSSGFDRDDNGADRRVEAKNETGGATVTRVDDDSGHDGADFVGDGVPVTTVGK